MDADLTLPDSAFVVLAVLAERPMHGYDLQKVVHDRGFLFWTQLRRSSSYKALQLLERHGLVAARIEAGAGPSRHVYTITERGIEHLHAEGLRKLAKPGHPRSEVDLAIYALPFLPRDEALAAFRDCREHLDLRAEFLRERLQWCRARGLRMPALSFERPLVALEAEIKWLDRLVTEYASGADLSTEEWNDYEYLAPPGAASAAARSEAPDRLGDQHQPDGDRNGQK